MRTRRHVVGVDRTVLTVVGTVLLLGGAGLVALAAGWLSDVGGLPGPGAAADLSPLASATSEPWWAGVCAGAAVVLLALGVWWLLAHRPGARTGELPLPGSRTGNRLRVVPDAVTRGAAAALEADARVRAAALVLREEHGRLVLHGRVRVASRTDVVEVGALVDDVARQVADVLGRDLQGRVHLAVARRGGAARRVL
ncbi:hypothetical protein ACQFYA_01755 [Promicromonospora sp. Marseille-Q5078]